VPLARPRRLLRSSAADGSDQPHPLLHRHRQCPARQPGRAGVEGSSYSCRTVPAFRPSFESALWSSRGSPRVRQPRLGASAARRQLTAGQEGGSAACCRSGEPSARGAGSALPSAHQQCAEGIRGAAGLARVRSADASNFRRRTLLVLPRRAFARSVRGCCCAQPSGRVGARPLVGLALAILEACCFVGAGGGVAGAVGMSAGAR